MEWRSSQPTGLLSRIAPLHPSGGGVSRASPRERSKQRVARETNLCYNQSMAPNVAFLGLDLYYWMILCGVVAAMILFRILYKKAGISYPVFVLTVCVSVGAIVGGYLFAALFQSFYSFLATGKFRWGVGTTFYGGLIGAAAVFLLLYFTFGRFFCKGNHKKEFGRMLRLITPCIALAHAFGRIGCLLDGCCYGEVSDFGLPMYVGGVLQKRVPLQLYESLFLFVLAGVLVLLLVKGKGKYNASIYLIAYGVWRFIIEFFRADDRGSSGLSFLSPSQLTAILLVLVGIILAVLPRFIHPKKEEKDDEAA